MIIEFCNDGDAKGIMENKGELECAGECKWMRI